MKIEVLPVPKSSAGGEIYTWQLEVDPVERIRIGKPHHDKYGTFKIETREGTGIHSTFGLPWYEGELGKVMDYGMIRAVLESGQIEQSLYEKLKEGAKKTTKIYHRIQGA